MKMTLKITGNSRADFPNKSVEIVTDSHLAACQEAMAHEYKTPSTQPSCTVGIMVEFPDKTGSFLENKKINESALPDFLEFLSDDGFDFDFDQSRLLSADDLLNIGPWD